MEIFSLFGSILLKDNDTKNKLKDIDSTAQKTGNTFDSVFDKIEKGAASVTEKMDKIGEGFTKVGKKLTLGLTTPLAGVAGAAIKVGDDFETSMSQAAGALDKPMSQMGSLRELALKTGQDTQFSATEAANAITELAKGGLTEAQIKGGALKATMDLAASSGMELGNAANTVVQAMGAFGLSANDSAKAVNALAGAAAASSTDVEPLSQGLAQCAAQAHLAGWSIQDTTAVLGEFADAGVVGSDAGTSLKTMLQRLGAPTDDAAKEMSSLGINVWDSSGHMKNAAGIAQELQSKMGGLSDAQQQAAMNTIFGSDATRAASILMNDGVKGLEKYTKATNDQSAASRLAQSQMGDTSKSIEQMFGSLETAGIKIQQALAPAIISIANTVGDLATSFSNLSPTAQKVILILGGIVAAAGPLLLITGSILTAIGTVTGAIAVLSTGAAAATPAVAGLASIFGLFSNIFTKIPKVSFAGMFTGLTNGLSSAGSAISKFIFGPWALLGNGLKSLPGLIKNFSFGNVIEKALLPFKSIPALFGKIPGLFAGLKTVFTGFGATIIALGPKVLAAIKSMFSIQGIITGAKTALSLFTGPWGALILVIMAGVGAIIANWSKIQAFANKIFNGNLKQTFTQFKNFFVQIWDSIKNNAVAVWNYIGPTIIGAVNRIKVFWNQTWPLLKQLFVEVWDGMKIVLAPIITALYVIISTGLGVIKGAWSSAWNAIKDTLKLVWDTITGIIKVAWDIVSGVVKVGLDLLTGHWSKAWDDFKSIFYNVWKDLKTSVGNIAKDALNWGKDIINGIINGIKGGIKALGDAVGNVAETIWKYLHHSVPEEGLLSDDDTWMPDFMQSMADGITDNTEIVTDALEKLTQKIKSKAQIKAPAVTTPNTDSGQNASTSLSSGLSNNQDQAVNPLNTLGSKMSNVMGGLANKFTQNGQQLNTNLGKGIADNSGATLTPLNNLLTKVTAPINTFIQKAINHGQDTDTNLGNGITNNSGAVVGAANKVTNTVGSNLDKFSNESIKYGTQTDVSISNGVNNTASTVFTTINNLTNHIKTLLQTFASSCTSIGKEIVDSIGSGIKSDEDNLTNIVHELTQKVIDAFTGKQGFDIHSPSRRLFKIGAYAIQGLINGFSSLDVTNFFQNKIASMIGSASGISGSLVSWLTTALAITGQSMSWLPALEQVAMHESGGDPRSINLWDINAKEGHPSKGLMQLIDDNMRYALPGMDDIWNPIDNAVAAIRYMIARYGSIGNVPGVRALARGGSYVGYEKGTDNATKGTHPVAENGFEIVLNKALKWFSGGETVLNNKDSIKFISDLIAKIKDSINNFTASYLEGLSSNLTVPKLSFAGIPNTFVDIPSKESNTDESNSSEDKESQVQFIFKGNYCFMDKKSMDEFVQKVSNVISLNIKRRRK
ncbi:phage tail tape measure protein [Clostridium coskatii]|uniref:Phage-related minor tail protein n=1 Tax=Clostridium coskatii TaxID=1705578 RepID=A0A166RDB4_9CLOT|nr:phage tail tape measure protein [Clostridium coskatii]OAA90704.1 Phage-related minor tail protein [Clostridium coskatii]OBR97460.1 phage-related minor tail protein [Clostridium coskatii]